jgi:hypothetical protein
VSPVKFLLVVSSERVHHCNYWRGWPSAYKVKVQHALQTTNRHTILSAITRNPFFWNVIQCHTINRSWCSPGTYSLHLQGSLRNRIFLPGLNWPLKTKAVCSFTMFGSHHPTKQHVSQNTTCSYCYTNLKFAQLTSCPQYFVSFLGIQESLHFLLQGMCKT